MAELGGGGGGGGRGDSAGDKAREEFFSEAQEIVDGLSRDLLALDQLSKTGGSDPELVNDAFRAVHTLKGLSGLFGAAMMAGLSHELEDLLDDLRLGRIEMTAAVLDLLFKSVDLYGRILASVKGDGPEPAAEVKALLVAFGQVTGGRGGGPANQGGYDLDPNLLGVLTEYEEHRLRTNIQAGLSLYRIRAQFSLASIDSALEEVKSRAKPHGEIITYLPTGSAGDIDSIELEILIASKVAVEVLRTALVGQNVRIDEVERAHRGSGSDGGGGSLIPPSPPPGTVADTGRDLAGEAPRAPRAASNSMVPGAPGAAGGAAGGGGNRELSLRSVSQTVRVDIRKLDHLMNIVGELSIVRGGMTRIVDKVRQRSDLRQLAGELHRLQRTFERHLVQMQNGILEVRMVPLGQVFEKLARIVRQISREADKEVNLVITGSETEIDKLIVEELSDPLMHMMRNAIDHGIELKDDRLRVGKPPVGTIALNAFQKGNHVLIEIEDDGAGMDPSVLIASAIRKGILTPEEAAELSSREVLSLVFRPGFTTREHVNNLSGRGVGMDVVKTNIGKLGGIVDISSEVGIGTKVTITLPITLAIISVLVLEVADETFCMPLASIEEAVVFDDAQVRVVEGREVTTQRGATLPLCRLEKLFSLERRSRVRTVGSGKKFVVIASSGGRRVGFVVDRLVGQQDIVIKALGRKIQQVKGFAGATELGDQRVGLVLDAPALIEEILHGAGGSVGAEGGHLLAGTLKSSGQAAN
jgi:two-component system chemotaxis sensor kinase CheA